MDVFSYRWVIAGIGLAAIFVVVLLPLMRLLPRRVLVGYVTAGAVFLLGAVVLETAGGFTERHFGQVTWHLMLLIQVEEWLEMLGVSLAIAVTASMVRWDLTARGVRTEFVGYRSSRSD